MLLLQYILLRIDCRIIKILALRCSQEIISHNCSDLVSAVPFFSEADPIFVAAIITKLRFEVFLEGDVIIQEGTVGTEMYFLREGSVEVRTKNGLQNVLYDGSYFGGQYTAFQRS